MRSKKLARPPDRLGGPPPRLGGGLCRRGLVEPLGPADDARLGRDAAAQSQSTGEGRSAAQSSGGLRAVANRPGSSAAALCRRPPPPGGVGPDSGEAGWRRRPQRLARPPGGWERTRIECCCALSQAPRAAACHGLLRTDQDRVLLRFVEGRPVSRVTRAVANRPGSSAAALCRRPPGQPRHTGCCELTRIECCCALSKAARSAASPRTFWPGVPTGSPRRTSAYGCWCGTMPPGTSVERCRRGLGRITAR